MLSNATPWMYEHAFYNGVVTQSLRFDEGSSPYLTRTPDSVGNRKTWTWSAWIKFSNVNHWTTLFASGSDNNNQTRLKFDDNGGRLFFDNEASGSSNQRFYSTRLFRDPSAWYNIVVAVDTTQATNTNRVKIYANGTQITAFAQSDYPAEDLVYNMNTTNAVEIGKQIGGSDYWDGYMADVNFIDGLQLTPSSFGEFKNGVWIPIDTSGLTFGTNGFKLKFDQTGVGTASTSTIGADTSGNTHHFTSSGIAASDCNMSDSPENNFATGNPLIPIPSGSLSEGNLAYLRGSNASHGSCGTTFTLPTTGKWYWEVMSGKSQNNESIGVANILDHNPQLPATGDEVGARTGDYIYRTTAVKVSGTNVAGGSSYGATYTGGDVIGVAWSSDDGTITFYKNNASQGIAYSSITQAEGKYVPAVSNAETSSETVFNFGQDSSFAGHKTAQGNTDGNGIGDFYYTPPSGFLALCSANLPEPTIGGISSKLSTDYFNTVLYTGNATDDRVVTTGLQTDWVWGKNRGNTDYHRLYDSSRGALKHLASNAADSESNGGDGGVKSFTSTGFTLDNTGYLNDNSGSYVSWNWKANGGTTSSNTDGAGTSTVQANTTAGFSIVTYTGSSNETYGHGLDSAPEMILVKGRNVGHNWAVYHQGVQDGTANGFLELNTTSAIQTGSNPRFLNGTTSTSQPTSTVFNVNHYSGSSTNATNNSDTYVAYCFHSVEGYSKIGSYTGNGNVDGTFIYTGFRPAWVMLKITNSADNWFIHDNKRDTFNTNAHLIYADLANAEYDASSDADNAPHDFISNGFKFRSSNANWNGNGNNYIYMAFAEAPFKYANAR